MSKLKPNKGLLKRVRVTAKGKVRIRKAFGRHLRSHKGSATLRGYRRPGYTCAADLKRMSAMLCTRLTRGTSTTKAKTD
jgi:ribosomal protein L35